MFPKCYKLPNTLSWLCPAVPAVLPLKQSRASLGSNAAVSLSFEFFLCKKGNSPQTPHVWGLSEITSMLVILDSYFLLPPSLWGSQQIKTQDSTPLPSKKVPFHKSRQSPNKVHFWSFMNHLKRESELLRKAGRTSRRSLWWQKYKCFPLTTLFSFTRNYINLASLQFHVKKMTRKLGFVHEQNLWESTI